MNKYFMAFLTFFVMFNGGNNLITLLDAGTTNNPFSLKVLARSELGILHLIPSINPFPKTSVITLVLFDIILFIFFSKKIPKFITLFKSFFFEISLITAKLTAHAS